MMPTSQPAAPVDIAFRIPGTWAHPGELLKSIPDDFRLTPEALIMPDGSKVDFGAAKADSQFAQIFRSSCRRPATEEELATVDNYKVNVFLSGPGGTKESAHRMMKAASAFIKAGGGGVFNDNSGLAHGGQNWLEMTDDGGPDALSFAFVSIIKSKTKVWTMGMHVLGLREVLMKKTDADEFDIIDVIRYLASSEKPIYDGHIIADLDGPRFRADAEDSDDVPTGSPMHNPFGRLRLVSMKDIAESN